MKAVQIDNYSKTVDSIKIREINIPEIKPDEVLVRVKSVGINPVDNMITRGDVKLITPYSFPLTIGNELAGVIEKTGEKVIEFKEGDRVFSRLPMNKIGAFAEYVAINKKDLAKIPEYLSFNEAAAIPLTALTAYQALDILQLKSGETLFISGGSGGFGAMAVPLAKARGIKVITNGSLENKERVLALGAEQFLDYKTEDYAQLLHDVDGVIDTIGGKDTEKQFSILKQGGKLVSLKGMPNGRFAKKMGLPLWKQWVFGFAGRSFDNMAKKRNQEYHFIFVQSSGEQLSEIAKVLEENQIRPSIDSIYSFEDIAKALVKVDKGSSRGKTIVEINK
ncbi:MAG: NADP-dependent oxidoreductase [Cardiobacteriaceae bacterium]|nr:NADP-dependent oxidoreductase [Cardiobacteriaceae bacterium]